MDGLKPSQRKIAFAANKLWKTGNEKPMKVFQLGGQAAAISFFHHGSLDGTIIGMTQTFKNSLPIFDGIGQFGSLRSPEAGAPRYVGVRFNRNFKLLYKDFELTTPQYEEGEEIEPKFFLPIIPTVLLNGGSGIAVGFATNILNRNPLDLVDACVDVLTKGKVCRVLTPWINGFYGQVKNVSGKTWIFKGEFSVKNTTSVEVTEIPPSHTYEKYEALLENLIEKGTLHSYEDFSKDRVRYHLKFPRQALHDLIQKDRLSDVLKLQEQETENLTTLDENGQLKVFQSAEELVLYFVDLRLKFYQLRKDLLISNLESDINILTQKAKFIKAVVESRIKVANTKKSDIILKIKEEGILEVEGSYDYLLSMAIYTLTQEKYSELLERLARKEEELVKIKATAPRDFYLTDLAELRKSLSSAKVVKEVKHEDIPETTDIFDILDGG